MELERKWEKFKGGPLAKRNVLHVTISRVGRIYLNAKAYEVLGRPKAVALYYSREDDAIAVQPAYERFAEHFPVQKAARGWYILAASFCRHYRIRVPSTERFLRPDMDKNGMLILNLRETVTVATFRSPKPGNVSAARP